MGVENLNSLLIAFLHPNSGAAQLTFSDLLLPPKGLCCWFPFSLHREAEGVPGLVPQEAATASSQCSRYHKAADLQSITGTIFHADRLC